MKLLLKSFIAVVVIAGIGAAEYRPTTAYFGQRNRPQWRTAKVSRGEIVADVKSTGTIQPVLKVTIGSFVSGPITKLHIAKTVITVSAEGRGFEPPTAFAAPDFESIL